MPKKAAAPAAKKNNGNSQKNTVKSTQSAVAEPNVSDGDLLTKWAIGSLKKLNQPGGIDLATFVEIIRAIESPWEVKDITMSYFGETKEAKSFANNFVEKRITIKKQQEVADEKQRGIEKAKQQLAARKRAQEQALEKRTRQAKELDDRKTSNDSDRSNEVNFNSNTANTANPGINRNVNQFFNNF